MIRTQLYLDKLKNYCYSSSYFMKKRSTNQTEHTSQGQELTLGSQCPLCTHEYKQDEVRVLEEQEGTQLLHITCAACHHAMLTFVMTSQLGTSSIGMLTDLSMQDVMRIKRADPLDEDAVLAFHSLLQRQTSSFIHLLT
jgi:hypothetical protein